MPRFSANLSMLFREHEFLDRFAAARDAGFGAVEMQFPYSVPVEDIRAAMAGAGIGFVVFNLPVGDLVTGGPGLAAMPGREREFRDAVALGRRYAEVLKPNNINVLAGWPPAEFGRQECLDVLAGNLSHAAAVMAEIGVRVLTEAVNTDDRPGYLLYRTSHAIEVIARAGHANLAIEHDLYHMQIMEGELLPTLRRHLGRIGHIQFADVPGRHEPGSGEIDFASLFKAIDSLGYDGWMGAEYNPSGLTRDSLDWMQS